MGLNFFSHDEARFINSESRGLWIRRYVLKRTASNHKTTQGNKSAVFPLQVLGYDVDAINTVQFSNHTGYPSHQNFGLAKLGYAVVKGRVFEDKDMLELVNGLQLNGLVSYSHILTGLYAVVITASNIIRIYRVA